MTAKENPERENRIRVGIIGASVERGWASMAHIPALRALPDYEITAVCTTNRASADKVARHFDIGLAFDQPEDLANHPEVDLVAVTVKASAHLPVLRKVIPAGKPVLCEWPVGRSLDETIELREAARDQGIAHFTGLQSRHIPALRFVQDLIAERWIGDVLSLDLVSTAGVWGATIHPGDAYSLDSANGATLLSIWGGHTLDMIWSCFGAFTDVSARMATQRKTVTVLGSGEQLPLKAPDNMMLSAQMASGAVASIRLRGGPQPGTSFLLEIIGSDGIITVEAQGIFAMVNGKLEVKAARNGEMELRPLSIPARYYRVDPHSLPPQAVNAAQMYTAIADDLANGTASTANFDTAVARKEQLQRIAHAGETGRCEPMSS